MEARALYRLLILYLLDQSKKPLSNTRITGFVLDQEYTNYFVLQQTISDLVDTGLIRPEPVQGNTIYYLTEAGKEALAFYRDRISDDIRNDVSAFLSDKQPAKGEAVAHAWYQKRADSQYAVTCQIKNREETLLTLQLVVPEEEQADAIRCNWEQQFIDVYTNTMDLLLF